MDRNLLLGLVENRSDIGGRFIRIRRLGAQGGSGNFSLVFSAIDTHTNRRVVIKVFNPDKRGETYRVACFQRESQVLERFKGNGRVIQCVAPVARFDETVSTNLGPFSIPFDYYILELARTDIEQLIEADRWSVKERLRAFRSMCRSIEAIHTANVAHRDLKPGNFLVMRNNKVKISDFGTAKALDPGNPPIFLDYGSTPGAEFPGATAYASPEMLASIHDADPTIALRADIYSLGAILFEIFTGRVLGHELFIADQGYLRGLRTIALTPADQRIAIYVQLMPQITGRYRPKVKDFARIAPNDVLDRVDELYQEMTNLDFRARLVDFSLIYLQIEICLKLVRRHEKNTRQERERLRREARREVRLRRPSIRLAGARANGGNP